MKQSTWHKDYRALRQLIKNSEKVVDGFAMVYHRPSGRNLIFSKRIDRFIAAFTVDKLWYERTSPFRDAVQMLIPSSEVVAQARVSQPGMSVRLAHFLLSGSKPVKPSMRPDPIQSAPPVIQRWRRDQEREHQQDTPQPLPTLRETLDALRRILPGEVRVSQRHPDDTNMAINWRPNANQPAAVQIVAPRGADPQALANHLTMEYATHRMPMMESPFEVGADQAVPQQVEHFTASYRSLLD